MKKSWSDAYKPRVCPRCRKTRMELDFSSSTVTEDRKQILCKACTETTRISLEAKRYRMTPEGRVTTILGGLTYRTKQANRVMELTRKELGKLLRKRTCGYCGRRFRKDNKEFWIVIDHVIPLARGGDTVVGNLVAACWRCNHSKGDKTLIEWEDRWYTKEKGD